LTAASFPLAVVVALVSLVALSRPSLVAADAVAPYVVTTREDVQRMLDLAGVGPGDLLIDLGSGDGRIPIAAAERGALGVGVEIDADLVAIARERAVAAGVATQTHFSVADIFVAPIAEASVVTLYLMPEVNLRLRPRLLCELRPGTRVVSNTFTMGEWEPDRHIPGRTSGGLLFWMVPASVAGVWQLDSALADTLTIRQHFQRVEVDWSFQGERLAVESARLRGSQLTWSARGQRGEHYLASVRVDGNTLHGAVFQPAAEPGLDRTEVEGHRTHFDDERDAGIGWSCPV